MKDKQKNTALCICKERETERKYSLVTIWRKTSRKKLQPSVYLVRKKLQLSVFLERTKLQSSVYLERKKLQISVFLERKNCSLVCI